tara:strand:+ start:279 stop:533 length:255 start_codon:yes stop_codon:yes gene_type:complete
MNLTTKIFLGIWIIFIIDSSGSVLCKFSESCLNLVKKFSILGRFGIEDSFWPYVYLGLSILGLVTVIMINKEKCKIKEKYKKHQ